MSDQLAQPALSPKVGALEKARAGLKVPFMATTVNDGQVWPDPRSKSAPMERTDRPALAFSKASLQCFPWPRPWRAGGVDSLSIAMAVKAANRPSLSLSEERERKRKRVPD